VFDEDRCSKLHTVCLAQIIHETHRNIDYFGLLLKQTPTRPAGVPERKETTGIHALNCNAFATFVDGHWAWLAPFTAVCKMHAAQLLTVLCSPNAQKNDTVLCGSGEQ